MDTSNLPAPLVILVVLVGAAGSAGIGGVIVTYLRDRSTSRQGERSVSIAEVEKAIPGLGEIIDQLRTQNSAQAEEIARQADRIAQQEDQLAIHAADVHRLERRVHELEVELAHERGTR